MRSWHKMRCQYNIKENSIKPVSTPNVVVWTGKNFPATGMICVWHLQFLSDGDTFQKLSETPESLVIPISPRASPGHHQRPSAIPKHNPKLWAPRPIVAGFPVWNPTAPIPKECACSPSSCLGQCAHSSSHSPALPWDAAPNTALGSPAPLPILLHSWHTNTHQDTEIPLFHPGHGSCYEFLSWAQPHKQIPELGRAGTLRSRNISSLVHTQPPAQPSPAYRLV